jgi:hypothetical protein
MPGPARRTLSLADLMILIAGVGVGMGCFLAIDDNLYGGGRFMFGVFRPLDAWNAATILNRAEGVFAILMTVFGAWTGAVPILAYRRPRALRKRLLRGSGMTACIAALAGLAVLVGATALAFLLRWVEGRTKLPPNFWYAVPVIECLFIFPGIAVASTWTAQLATGRWRAVPDAVDRMGRFVGGLWASAALVFAVRMFLG